MKFLIIIALFVLSNEYPFSLLKKYETAVMDTQYVLFESKDFKDDEEMHFKLKTYRDYFDFYYNSYDYDHDHDIIYYYSDSSGTMITSGDYSYRKNHDMEDGLENNYFTIKKRRSEYRPTDGKYLLIYFPNLKVDSYYEAFITNTEEDEGKIETWVIVVIIVICVAIIAGIIIYCICRRIRMKKAQQAALATNVAAINAQKQANQAAYNYAAQNAAYAAAAVENAQNAAYAAGVEDAQNAYLAQQNQAQVYQGRGQTYQAQVYQNNNYTSPPLGSVPDTGYNSKAVM